MEKKLMVTHVGAGSIGRLVDTVNAIFAVAAGIIGSIAATANVVATQDYSVLMNIAVSVGIILLGVVVVPLFAFVFGWLYGALVGVIWNILLGATGGLEVNTHEVPAEETKK